MSSFCNGKLDKYRKTGTYFHIVKIFNKMLKYCENCRNNIAKNEN